MKGKIVASLFALPFLGVGVWMLWSISSGFYDAWRMQSWVPVEARILRAGYETHSGEDSDTYEAYAVYNYDYLGGSYTGDRVAISKGGDNIGDYQTEIGHRLSRARTQGESITVYVNPEQPSESIIDRELRWGLIGFKSIFLFVFGGVGLGLLILVFRVPKEKDADSPAYRDAPWLLNDQWQTPTIRSGSRTAMWFAWAFAAFWNLLSAALPFIIYDEVVNKDNTVALVALLFPLIGLGLIVWALRRTLEWKRFGATPVTLDPFPGSIGGHVGGTIDIMLPFDSTARFQLTLTNIRSRISGSGKNRNRKEKADWQEKQIAHAEPGSAGTRLSFRFDVPEGLSESDAAKDGDEYAIWRLNLKAELPSTDLDRDFEIPVYRTAEESRHLSERTVQRANDEQAAADDQSVRAVVQVRYSGTGKQLYYPPGRHLSASIGGLMVGAIFAGAGWFLIFHAGERIMGGVFGGVGALVALFCLYIMLNSLEVFQDGHSIVSLRRVLGIPISRKHMHRNAFVRFSKDSSLQTQSGSEHVIYYSISAVDTRGNKLVLGEGFKGNNEADAAIRLLARELGLRVASKRETTRRDDDLLGTDVLTTDH